MEQGTIIAIVSLVTTAVVTIWSKRIDAKQKINEHQLSLRNTYVNKKIEAGIDFVGKTNVRINTHYLVTVFYKYLYDRDKFNKEYYDAIINARNKQRETNLSINNSIHLFFDILTYNDRANDIIHEINDNQSLLSTFFAAEGSIDFTSAMKVAAKKNLDLNEELVKVYQQMIGYIRSEIAKYDIVQSNKGNNL